MLFTRLKQAYKVNLTTLSDIYNLIIIILVLYFVVINFSYYRI